MSGVNGIGQSQNIQSVPLVPPRQPSQLPELYRELMDRVFSELQVPEKLRTEVIGLFNSKKTTINFASPKNLTEEYSLRACAMMLRNLGFKADTQQDFADSIKLFGNYFKLSQDSLDISPEFQKALIEQNVKILQRLSRCVMDISLKKNPFAERAIKQEILNIWDGKSSKIALFDMDEEDKIANLTAADTGAGSSSDMGLDAVKTMLEAQYGPIEEDTMLVNALITFAGDRGLPVLMRFDDDPEVTQAACKMLLSARGAGISDQELLEMITSGAGEKIDQLKDLVQLNMPSGKEDRFEDIIQAFMAMADMDLTSEQVNQIRELAPKAKGKNALIIHRAVVSSLLSAHETYLASKEAKPFEIRPEVAGNVMEVDRIKPEEVVDRAPIIAIKAALYRKGVSVSSPGVEGLTAEDVRSFIKVFGQDGWSLSFRLSQQEKASLEGAAERIKTLKTEDLALLNKIIDTQKGISVRFTDKEKEKIESGALEQVLSGIANDPSAELRLMETKTGLVAGEQDTDAAGSRDAIIKLASAAADAAAKLKIPGVFKRVKNGLPPEESARLREFADALEKGAFEAQTIKVKDEQGNDTFAVASLRDKEEGLFNDSVRIMLRVGWQLSEIVMQAPTIERREAESGLVNGILNKFAAFGDAFIEGTEMATKKQKIKVNGVELPQIIALKAILLSKGEAEGITARLEAIRGDLDILNRQTDSINKKIADAEKILKDNGIDFNELERIDPKTFEYLKGLAAERAKVEQKVNVLLNERGELADYLTSDRIDLRFWDKFRERFKGSERIFSGIELLEGTVLTDMNNRAVAFPYTLEDGVTVLNNPAELVGAILKRDGGWSTLSIVPGESKDTSLAKKTLSMMISNLSMFKKITAAPLAVFGAVPTGGVIPTVGAKLAGAAGMGTDLISPSIGATSDSELGNTMPDGTIDFIKAKAITYWSGFTGDATNPYMNMTPLLHTLILNNAESPEEMVDTLSCLLSSGPGTDEDIIGNMSRIDSDGVAKAKDSLRKMETRINAVLERHPEWINKIYEELKNDPVIMRALRIDVEHKVVHFDFGAIESGINTEIPEIPQGETLQSTSATVTLDMTLVDQLIKDMGNEDISLFYNPYDMENRDLIPGARRLMDCIMAAYSIRGIMDGLEAGNPLATPVRSYDVVDGIRDSGITEYVSFESQSPVSLGTHIKDAAYAAVSNPVDFGGTALLEAGKQSLYFGTMPLNFGLMYTKMAGDCLQIVHKWVIEGDREGARDIANKLIRETGNLFGQITSFGFDPRTFLENFLNKLEEGTPEAYAQAFGSALVISGFALYVANRTYNIGANAGRWVQGRQTTPIGFSTLEYPIKLPLDFVSWGTNNVAERIGLGQQARYNLPVVGGRTWEEGIVPAFKRGWDKVRAVKIAAKERMADPSRFPVRQIGSARNAAHSSYEKMMPELFQEYLKYVGDRVAYYGVNLPKRAATTTGRFIFRDIIQQGAFGKMYQKSQNWTRENKWLNPVQFREIRKQEQRILEELNKLQANYNPTVEEAREVIENLQQLRTQKYTEIGGPMTGRQGLEEAGRMAQASISPRQGVQATFAVEPSKNGFEVKLVSGDPRNVIFEGKLMSDILSSSKSVIPSYANVSVDGKKITVPIKEISIVPGNRIGYDIFTYEGGEPGVRLHIGQGLLLSGSNQLQQGLTLIRDGITRVDHASAALVEDKYTVGGEMPEPEELSKLQINGTSVDEVINRVNGLEPRLKDKTWDELRQISRQVEAEFSQHRRGTTETGDLVRKMDAEQCKAGNLSMSGGGFPTFLELRLAVAREMARRITDSKAGFGNGAGQLPKAVRDRALKNGMTTMPGGKRLTAMQLRGVLVMHTGNFANIFMGEGKTLEFGTLVGLNAVTGQKQYFNTFDTATARVNHREVIVLLDEMGVKTAAPSYTESSTETNQRAFRDAQVLFVSRSDLKFIVCMNRAARNSKEIVPIDFKGGMFASDEFDFMAVDEGQTPHIISGPALGMDPKAKEWNAAWALAAGLVPEQDFRSGEKGIEMTDAGKAMCGWATMTTEDQHRLVKCIEAARLVPGIDYEIKYWGNTIVLIDKNTGRLLKGREWSDGLHQAVQAKHGITITAQMQTIEQITEGEFGKMITWEVGASGSAQRIAPVLATRGRKIFVIERSVPEYFFNKSLSADDQMKMVKELQSQRKQLDPEYDGRVQITCSAEDAEEMKKFLKHLESQNVNATNKIMHAEVVLKTKADVISEAVKLIKHIRASGDSRPVIIPLESPAMAEALRKALEKEGLKLTLDTHKNSDADYIRMVDHVWSDGEIVASTRIRRASDMKAKGSGAILISLEHSITRWAYDQKLGRWPRFGANGEVVMLSSAEDDIFKHRLGSNGKKVVEDAVRASKLEEPAKQRLISDLQDEKTTYGDALVKMRSEGIEDDTVLRVIEAAADSSDISVFNRESRLSDIGLRFAGPVGMINEALSRMQSDPVEESIRNVVIDEVAAAAERHGITGQRSDTWDIEGFRRELKDLLPATKVTLNISQGASAEDVIRTAAGIVEDAYIGSTAKGIKTGVRTAPEFWRAVLLDKFNTERRQLMLRQQELERMYESRRTGSQTWSQEEGIFKEQDSRASIDEMQLMFFQECRDNLSKFNRSFISALKTARGSKLRPWWWKQHYTVDVKASIAQPSESAEKQETRPAGQTEEEMKIAAGSQSGRISEEQARVLQSAQLADAPKQAKLAQSVVEGLISPKARFVDPETAAKIGSVTVLNDADFDRIKLSGDAAFVKDDAGRYTVYIRKSAIKADRIGDLTPESQGRLARAVTHELAEIYLTERFPDMPADERSAAAHFAAQMVEAEVSTGDPKLGFTSKVQRASDKAHAVAEAMSGDAARSINIGGAMGFGMSMIVYGIVPEIWKNGLENISTKEYWDPSLNQSWDAAVRGAFFAARDNLVQDYVSAVLCGTNYSNLQEWQKTSFLRKAGFTGVNMGAMMVTGILDDAVMWADMPVPEELKGIEPNAVTNKDLALSKNPYLKEYYYKMMTWKMIQGSSSNAMFEAPQILMTFLKIPMSKVAQYTIRTAAGVAINMASREGFERTILGWIRDEYLGENGKVAQYAAGTLPYEDGLTGMHELAQFMFSNPEYLEKASNAASFLSNPIKAQLAGGAAAQTIGRLIPGKAAEFLVTNAQKQAAEKMIEETAYRIAVKKLGEEGAKGLARETILEQFGPKAAQRVSARIMFANLSAAYYSTKFGWDRGAATGDSAGEYSLNASAALAGGGAIGVGTGLLTFGFSKAALSLGPIGIVAGGLGFLGGVSYQIIDQQNIITAGLEEYEKTEEEKNKIAGVRSSLRGWVVGTANTGGPGVLSEQEAMKVYGFVARNAANISPEDIMLLSSLGFKRLLGVTISDKDESKALSDDLDVVEQQFNKGVWKTQYNEEQYIDRICPNWRYLVSKESGERDHFSNRLPSVYASKTVTDFVMRLDDPNSNIVARNLVAEYMKDPVLENRIRPCDFWKETEISPVATREDIARENEEFLARRFEFIVDNLSDESVEKLQTMESISDEQMAQLPMEAAANYATLSSLTSMDSKQRAFLRRAGIEIDADLLTLRQYPKLWSEIRGVLGREGILAQACFRSGFDNISDLEKCEDPQKFASVVFGAMVMLARQNDKTVGEFDVTSLKPNVLQMLMDISVQRASIPADISLSNIASSNGKIAIPLVETRKYKGLFAEIYSKLNDSGIIASARAAADIPGGIGFAGLSDKQLYEVLSEALKIYQQRKGFVVNQDIGFIDSSIAIQLTSAYSRSRTHYVGGLRGMASGGRR